MRTILRLFWEKMKVNLRLVLIVCASFFEIFLNFGRMICCDYYQYVGYALFFLGKQHTFSPFVVMRPMVPLLASPLIMIFDNVNLAFGLISGFFWLSGAVIAYKLGLLLLGDEDLATMVSLSYTTAPILLYMGAAVLTDSAGFFFIGLTVYLTLKRERQVSVSSKTYFLDALFVCFGIMFRETVLFALLFMLLRRLVKKKGLFEMLLAAGLVGVLELVFLHTLGLDVSIFVHKYSVAKSMYYYSPSSWGLVPHLHSLWSAYVMGLAAPTPYFLSLSFWLWTVPILIFGTFSLLGFVFGAGKKDLLMCLFFLFPSSVVWPRMRPRFSFCMWPAIIPAMVIGTDFALSKIPFFSQRKTWRSKIVMYLYIITLAIVNTLNTVTNYGSPTI